MEINVLTAKGTDTGRKVTLSAEIFGIEPNDHAIYLDVKQYLANQRQGTHKAKQKHEVSGSTRKLHRQKGTGGARKGSIKSPLFPGGARVFGPQPRDYSFKLNKKQKSLARKSAYSYKAKEANIKVLEAFNFAAPKTKDYITLLADLNLTGKKTLLVLPENNDNVYLSSRNLQKTKVITANYVTTYDLLNAEILLLSEGSLEKISHLFNENE